ncbi:hypothetical protein BKA56DRAFT_636212 [Ilyonectria sp. MPI-CAGE-AT-0026]|nr:hypothetical protein BKA56DRAFT_636212 [Ilyonectria sp. MPI-CAGE-AT-0026]
MPKLPFITLEEHVFTQFMWDKLQGTVKKGITTRDPFVEGRLLDVGNGRIATMDSNSIQTQVLSHIPSPATLQDMRRINEEIRDMKNGHPNRYQGFAFLSLHDPAEAAQELERCVKEFGFVGALFGNTLEDGTFFDTPNFYPLYKKAQELDVPLYFHPAFPSLELTKNLFQGPYSEATAIQIGAWCYGWHATIAIHILRLFAAGIFDKFPRVKIVIGHMGETLPFMLDRIIPQTANWPGAAERQRELRQVWDENIWITTSGMFALGPMACLLRTTKIDRIMFSVDYPLEGNDEGLRFIEDLRASGLVSEEDLEKIAYKNAKALLRI